MLAFLLAVPYFAAMADTDWYKPAHGPTALTLSQVERALGHALGAPFVARSRLRARIKHLMKLGLVSVEKGRSRARYGRGEIAKLLIGLILQELSVDPVVVVSIVRNEWPILAGLIEQATSHEIRGGGRPPYYLCVWSQAMSGPWTRKPAISLAVLPLQELNPLTPTPNQHFFQLVNAHRGQWLSVFNLTDLFTRVEAALPL
jgi:hypothetical protein